MDSNPNTFQSSIRGRGMDALQKIFGKYDAPSKNLSLLSMHLYEVSKGCQEYLKNYEALFKLPKSQTEEQEQLLDVLAGVDALLEYIQHHAKELKEQIKDFVSAVEPEDEPNS